MVNMLTQQIETMFNSLIKNTNQSYQQLAHQVSRIADFFGAHPTPIQLVPNQFEQPISRIVKDVVLKHRNEDANNIVMRVQ